LADYGSYPKKSKYSQIYLSCSRQDSGDLESATKTITATAEASGLGSADYSKAMTLTAGPSDARLVVNQIAARLNAHIDSLNAGAAHLYCRVYIDAQDANHRLLDVDCTVAAADNFKLGTAIATLLALLQDNASHTYYFFFWVDAGNAVISACQLWVGVAGRGTGTEKLLTLSFTGDVNFIFQIDREGTGTPSLLCYHPNIGNRNTVKQTDYTIFSSGIVYFYALGTVATDLNYLTNIEFTLKES
jgi:hypothetical protein